ncbi:MAG: DUF2752 domain-containing protein, partial [Actinomycetes bacterium]
MTDVAPPEPGPTGPGPAPEPTGPPVTGVPAPTDAPPLWRTPALVGAGVAGASLAIAAWNPTDSGTPLCWSQSFLGVDCPFCGGLRCVNSLVRGDWLAAADHNVLLAVALPVAAVLWVVWLVKSVRGERFELPKVPTVAWVGIVVFLVAFTVARNVG